MCCRFVLLSIFLIFASSSVTAQQLNEAIVFGDSNVDSGFYKAFPDPGATPGGFFNNNWAKAVAAGAGKPTSSPGLMNSEALAAYFGLTALPANQPGGTNYASSGAKNDLQNNAATGGFTRAVPTTQQVLDYLNDKYGNNPGGGANPNAIYLINSGANDIAFAVGNLGDGPHPADPKAFVAASANSLASSIAGLKAAGARYIIVPGQPFEFPKGDAPSQVELRDLRLTYTQTLWSGLAAQDVNFIPADINAVRKAIFDDFQSGAKTFGFEFIDTNDQHTACQRPGPGVGDAYALLCSSNPAAPSQFANPTADQTRLFADNEGHLSTAGQKIMADYFYSLVVAPSQISFLPETAVKTRTRLVSNIQTQIDASAQQPPGPNGLNVWVTGDVSHLKMENYHGFPDDPSTPASIAAGVSKRVGGGLILGAAISAGHLESDFSGGRGDYSQEELSGSIYAAYLGSPFWGTVIGTYGSLDYDVNRIVPIGITLQRNSAETDGHNISVAAQGGIDFKSGPLTHGPVVGLTWQRISVDGFTEEGGFTSLAFGDQTRDSAITALGYRVSFDLGLFRPFAQATWNHELASTDRDVTASLTTIAAPSYYMPAVVLGRDWGTAIVGTNIRLAPGVSALAAFSTEFGQDDAVTYGGQIGLNIAF